MSAPLCSFLCYDLPENIRFANPSPRLRRIAVRVNLSVWVIPNHSLPHHLLAEMDQAGGRWYLVAFDASEADKLAEMAASALRREIVNAVRVARDAEVKAGQSEDPGERAKYWKRVRAALSRAKRLLKDAKQAAQNFNLDPDTFSFDNGFQAITALTSAAKTRAHLYAEAAKSVQGQGHSGDAIASAMRADALHPMIAADYAEEQGINADAMREAFID